MKNVKIGLALGSGSSRGWAHIGVIEALEELGILPHVICGTSVGSLVGASYAAGKLASLKEWVCSLTMLGTATFFDVTLSRSGFVNKEKLNQFFEKHVADNESVIEDLPLRYAAVATELNTGRELWLTKGPVLQAVWSSIALPGIFPPVYYKERWLLDGGLVNPVPVSMCRALGADIVFAVNLNGDLLIKQVSRPALPEKSSGNFMSKVAGAVKGSSSTLRGGRDDNSGTPPGLLESIAGSINIAQDRITRSRMAGDPPDVILLPRLGHIGLLEFYRAEEAIEEGRQCVQAALPAIERTLHHIL